MSELQELQTQENDALTKFNTVNSKQENSVLFVNQQQNQFQILLLCLCLVMFITFKYLDMPSQVYNLFLITGVALGFMLIAVEALFVNQNQNQFQILILLLSFVMFDSFKNFNIVPSIIYNLLLITGGVFGIMVILMQTLFINQRENQEENQFHILLLLLFLMMFEIFKNYYI
jgi:hypothetical protein